MTSNGAQTTSEDELLNHESKEQASSPFIVLFKTTLCTNTVVSVQLILVGHSPSPDDLA